MILALLYLTVNSIPWAYVYVDGRRVGTTPIRKLRVRAGRRRIVLKDAQGRRMRSFVGRVRKGQTEVFSFDKGR